MSWAKTPFTFLICIDRRGATALTWSDHHQIESYLQLYSYTTTNPAHVSRKQPNLVRNSCQLFKPPCCLLYNRSLSTNIQITLHNSRNTLLIFCDRQPHLGSIVALFLEVNTELGIFVLDTILIQSRDEEETNYTAEGCETGSDEEGA
jgi:hypothetical protein